jgi:hypothetical protein
MAVDRFSKLLKGSLILLSWNFRYVYFNVLILVTLCELLTCCCIDPVALCNLSLLIVNLSLESFGYFVILVLNCKGFHLLVFLQIPSFVSQEYDGISQCNSSIKVVAISCQLFSFY